MKFIYPTLCAAYFAYRSLIRSSEAASQDSQAAAFEKPKVVSRLCFSGLAPPEPFSKSRRAFLSRSFAADPQQLTQASSSIIGLISMIGEPLMASSESTLSQ